MGEAGRDYWRLPGPPPAQIRVQQNRLLRALSDWILGVSNDGKSTVSLGSLLQRLTSLTVKKFCLMFKWNFLCFSFCLWLLVLLLGTAKSALIFFSPPNQIFLHIAKKLNPYCQYQLWQPVVDLRDLPTPPAVPSHHSCNLLMKVLTDLFCTSVIF